MSFNRIISAAERAKPQTADIQREIYYRMLENVEFQFATLHTGLPEEAYRMADKTLQQCRKHGFASFRKDGRKFIWSLTDAGREALKDPK